MCPAFDYNNNEEAPPSKPVQKPASPFTTVEDLPAEPATVQAGPAQTEGIVDKGVKEEKKVPWQENKKIAGAVLVVGMIIILVVFYFLFHSAGII